MISASVTLTQPQGTHRQFIATSGTGHHLLLDDAAGNTGAKPIELVAIALAGCTAFDDIGEHGLAAAASLAGQASPGPER